MTTNDTQQTPTPRVDAAIIEFEYEETLLGGEVCGGTKEMIDPDFARQLERENAELREALGKAHDTMKSLSESDIYYVVMDEVEMIAVLLARTTDQGGAQG